MNEDDVKQMMIDTMREERQEQIKAKAKSIRSSRPANRKRVNFSKMLIIFLSIIFAITWGITYYLQLTQGIYDAEIKRLVTMLYSVVLGTYQIRRGIEGRRNPNAPTEESFEDEYGDYE